jgi:hypothetical protein
MSSHNETPLPGVGRIAERDDIAPEGEVITEQDVLAYRADVEAARRRLGLPTENLWETP